jgi:cytoskeletal protein RodZ
MLNKLEKIPSYFEWLIIVSAFISLIISIISFLFVIYARKRVRRAEEMVQQIIEAVNKLSIDAHKAAESAALSSATAKESAKSAARTIAVAEESAKSAKVSVIASSNSAKSAEIAAGFVNRATELLMSRFNEKEKMLGDEKDMPPTQLEDPKK